MNAQNPAASHGIAIQAVDLVKDYGTGDNTVHALRNVNVSFERGKFTAIMGPSGSGKSTLMHTLAGLDSATSGHILFGGADLTRMNDKQLTLLRRHKIGFIFQSFNLLPMFTAEQNILMPLTLAGDKPDSVSSAEVLGFLKRSVNELGQTIVMVTHDAVAASYADRAIVFSDGRIVADEQHPNAEVMNELLMAERERTTRTTLTDTPADQMAQMAGVRNVPDLPITDAPLPPAVPTSGREGTLRYARAAARHAR